VIKVTAFLGIQTYNGIRVEGKRIVRKKEGGVKSKKKYYQIEGSRAPRKP
jgi:hypothetical protein